jgi:hypothetical protein
MKPTFKPLLVQDVELPAISEMTELACSIGRELAQRWPYAIARIRIALPDALTSPVDRRATGEAFVLGLSGLTERRGEARKVAGILALNRKMMAIRLNGRTLVAFTPDRDIRFTSESDRRSARRVQASAWSPSGQLLGVVERVGSRVDGPPGNPVAAERSFAATGDFCAPVRADRSFASPDPAPPSACDQNTISLRCIRIEREAPLARSREAWW